MTVFMFPEYAFFCHVRRENFNIDFKRNKKIQMSVLIEYQQPLFWIAFLNQFILEKKTKKLNILVNGIVRNIRLYTLNYTSLLKK